MPWGSGFLGALTASSKVPMWEFVSEWVPALAYGTGTVATSHAQAGSPVLIVSAPSISGQRIQPITWAPTSAAWSVKLSGTDCHRAIGMCPRGSIVSLWCTLDGYRERVALGVVRNLSGSSQDWSVDVQDISTALTSRLKSDPFEGELFHDLADGDTTVATGGYTAGDPTLTVTSAAGLKCDSVTGRYTVLVTSTSGSQFYVTGTLAGNVLTIATAGDFGTTDANAAAGNLVTACALLEGHPLDLMRRILTSGSGGAFASLPDSWGLGVTDSWFDHSGITTYRDLVTVATSGAYTWRMVFAAPLGSPWSVFAALLSQAGIWMTMRQGDIVFRACQNVFAPATAVVGSVTALQKGPKPGWSWQQHAQEITYEYAIATVSGPTTSKQEPGTIYGLPLAVIQSHPSLDEASYDLSAVAWSNEAAVLAGDVLRLAFWAVLPPEAFSFQIPKWRAAQWCDGDLVQLDLPELRGIATYRGHTYEGVPAMIVEAAPDWSGDGVRLRVLPLRQEL